MLPVINIDITDHLEHDDKLSDESEIKDTLTLNEIYLDLTSELLQKWIKSETNKRKNANKNSDDKCILTGAWAFLRICTPSGDRWKIKQNCSTHQLLTTKLSFSFIADFLKNCTKPSELKVKLCLGY